MWLDLSGEPYNVVYQTANDKRINTFTYNGVTKEVPRRLLCIETRVWIAAEETGQGWKLNAHTSHGTVELLHIYGTEEEVNAALDNQAEKLGAVPHP